MDQDKSDKSSKNPISIDFKREFVMVKAAVEVNVEVDIDVVLWT